MGFLDKIFGKDKKSDLANSKDGIRLSKNVGVPYNKDLIKTLKKDHQKLFEEFGKILKAAQNKKYKLLKQYLKAFKVNFEIHNYSEKIQLYTYLKNYYKNEDMADFIEDMAVSAENIYQDIISFIKKYETVDFNDQYLLVFKKEMEALGKILQSRVEVEESELYPLYKK